MQQLTIQFDGYAPAGGSIDAGAAKRRSLKLSDILPGWALLQQNPSEALDRVVANARIFASATLCVCFGFSLMFLAAVIGG